MKKVLIAVGALVVLAIVALLVAPLVIPVDTYKTQILTQIEKATGRKARIDGDFSVSLLPRAEFTAGKFTLANAPGGTAPNMVSLEKLNVQVALLPLLGGNLVIDSFVMEKPDIALEADKNGRGNWVFTPVGPDGKPVAADAKKPQSAGDSDGGGSGLSGLQLGDVRLVDGRVSYRDAATGTVQIIDKINMTVALPSFTSPLEARGSLVWNKEKIDLALDIANPDAFLKGDTTGLGMQVSSAPVKLEFRGNASSGKVLKAAGNVDLDVPSVRKLAAWAGSPLDAPGTGFGPMKIAGRVSVDGQKYAFTKAKLSFDAIEGTGDFRFDGSGRVPYINARLDTGMLDINPYLPPENKATGGAAAPGGSAAGTAPAAKAGPGEWSDAPIDLSALRSMNADAALNVAGLNMRKITIGKSAVKVALKGGRLTTDLTEMALYNGNGKARVTVNASGATPAVAASMDLAGLQANPALSDAIDFTRIEGTLNTDLSVSTSGRSQRAMISALGGKGKFQFRDGAVRGINLGAMVRNVTSAFLDPSARETQKTDFAELSGSFDIVRGILRNNDLTLLSPLLRVAGKGSVDLPKRTVNYRVEPKVVASAEGQGGKSDASGIKVPVVVSGPWHNISYKPDLAGALGGIAKDPKKALDGLKNLVPGSKSSGGSGGGSAPNPADALKKLFGR